MKQVRKSHDGRDGRRNTFFSVEILWEPNESTLEFHSSQKC